MILHMSQSLVTQLHDIEKIIKDFGADDVIQHSNSMLVLYQVYKL